MKTIMPALSRWEKRKLRVWISRETDAGLRTRRRTMAGRVPPGPRSYCVARWPSGRAFALVRRR